MLSESNYPPKTPIKIVPRTNVFYKGHINGLVFLLCDKLVVLIKHPSTKNENVSVRLLIYIVFVYNAIYRVNHIVYGTTKTDLPEPELYILYNGTDSIVQPRDVKRLSDLYFKEGVKLRGYRFYLKVTIFNVNAEMVLAATNQTGIFSV